MSTFCGRMKEYDLISLDRFDGVNMESSAYFLSHKHADHMLGLSNSTLAYRLSSNKNIRLYCSPVTRELLSFNTRYSHLLPFTVPLDLDVPIVMQINNPLSDKPEYEVTVTLLSAAHCPGSVMFLFEGIQGTVLYTGDFRLCVQDVMQMDALHHAPGMQDCVSAVLDIMQEWLDESPNHCVFILHRANLGYEHLFVEACKHFQMPVHVDENRYKQYQKIADLSDFVTNDPSATRIHACRSHGRRSEPAKQLPCGYKTGQVKVRTIAVSTLCFVQHVGVDVYTKRYSENFFRACYSFHSSYSEIREMVQYLKPLRAFANVAPDPKIQKTLDGFVASASAVKQINNSEDFKLGKLKKARKRRMRQISEDLSSDQDSLLSGDSPLCSLKKRRPPPPPFEPSTPDKYPALFSATLSSDDEVTCLSDADMFEDVDWIKGDRSFSQEAGDFGEHCSMLINEGEEEKSEEEKSEEEEESSQECSPSLLATKKVVDLTLSSLESDSQPKSLSSQNSDIIDITSSLDL